MILSVGSRSSDLAQKQSEYVVNLLEEEDDVRADLTTTDSLGDRHDDADPGELDETGIFTSAIDEKLLDGRFDLVIHSLKDCPTDTPEELTLAAIPPRVTPFDVLVGSLESDLNNFEPGTVIGTSSIRRRANLLHENPDLSVESCRGNVPTRLEKLEDEDADFDALVLAAAGLERLEMSPKGRIFRRSEMLPAPGQGALAIMCRSDQPDVVEVVSRINHRPSELICRAERAFLSRLEGGCQAPIGALANIRGGTLKLTGSVLQTEGKRKLEETVTGPEENADELGLRLADTLIDQGAEEFLER